MGQVVLSVLSTPAGYTSAVTLTSTGVRLALRDADVAVRAVGRFAAIATGAACAAIGSVIPALRDTLIVAHADAVDRVNHVYDQATGAIALFGEQAHAAAHTRLVQTVATRAAAAASALLVLHVITKGAIGWHIVGLVPPAAGLVAWMTSPWLMVFAVTGATVGSLGYALRVTRQAALDGLDIAVDISADGTVTVSGVPQAMSATAQTELARRASEEAIVELERDLKSARGRHRRSVVNR